MHVYIYIHIHICVCVCKDIMWIYFKWNYTEVYLQTSTYLMYIYNLYRWNANLVLLKDLCALSLINTDNLQYRRYQQSMQLCTVIFMVKVAVIVMKTWVCYKHFTYIYLLTNRAIRLIITHKHVISFFILMTVWNMRFRFFSKLRVFF